MIFEKTGKTEEEILKEKLSVSKKNGVNKISLEELEICDKFSEGYKEFLNESKTERESIEYSVKLLKEKGFVKFNRNQKYKPGDRIYYINRGKSIIIAVIGIEGTKKGVNISVAHVDSPRLDLKPVPLYEDNGLALFKTHYYGGIKKYQWPAIPLALHGVIIRKDGEKISVKIGENSNEPCFCTTDLLPHLAKEQMEKTMRKGVTGEDLNVLVGSRAFKSDKGSELVKLNVLKLLSDKYGIIEEDFISSELELVPAFKAQDIGFDKSMIGAYGHDDKVCSYPSLIACLDCEIPEKTAVVVLADKEETGSSGNTGMNSEFFKYFIADLADQDGMEYRHVLSNSKCLSADVNAAFDPNYPSPYDSLNSCYVNRGVVLTKYTGNGGKGGTSDCSAEFMFEIRKFLNDNDVVWQTGELGKIDAGGGGTIAKYIAKLDVDVVDLGVPVLSMHSPFEVISKFDLYMTYKAIKAFLK